MTMLGETMVGGTPAGWLFLAATVALFAWGLYLGIRGATAHHPPFRQGANAPGARARSGFDAA